MEIHYQTIKHFLLIPIINLTFKNLYINLYIYKNNVKYMYIKLVHLLSKFYK